MRTIAAAVILSGAIGFASPAYSQSAPPANGTPDGVLANIQTLQWLLQKLDGKQTKDAEKAVRSTEKQLANTPINSPETAQKVACEFDRARQEKERVEQKKAIIRDLLISASKVYLQSINASQCKPTPANPCLPAPQNYVNILNADLASPNIAQSISQLTADKQQDKSKSGKEPITSYQQNISQQKTKLATAWTSADTAVSITQSSTTYDAKLSQGAHQSLRDAESVDAALQNSQKAANLLAASSTGAWAKGAATSSTAYVINSNDICGAQGGGQAPVSDPATTIQIENALTLELAYNNAFIDDKLTEITTLGYYAQAFGDLHKPPSTASDPDEKRPASPAPANASAGSSKAEALDPDAVREASVLALLAKFPDTNFTGTNKTATLQAGSAGSTASISYGLEDITKHGDNLFSFTFSSPTSSSGSSTSLYDHADGFANMASMKISDTRLHMAVGDSSLLLAGGWLQAGYQQHQYYALSDLKTEQSSDKWPLGLGFFGGWAGQDGSENAQSLTVNASWQQSYKDQKSQTACPLPAAGSTTVTCVNGSINAPSDATAGVLSVAFRKYLSSTPFSITYSLNSNTHVRELDVPVYLFHSSDKATSSTFNGGLDVNWTNTEHWNIGVFVGAPIPALGGN